MTRRFPVYLILDTSGSMLGEPIAAVNNGLKVLVAALMQDPHALESVHISIITFDRQAKVVLPLTPIDGIVLPEISTPESGPTHLGDALSVLETQFRQDVRRSDENSRGDWAPFALVMTDGKASDRQTFEQMATKIKTLGFGSIIGCLAGPDANQDDLKRFCDPVVSLDTLDNQSFSSLFKWVSTAIAGKNRSLGAAEDIALPPPPSQINI
jgi:uncharacterized protein YegL